MIFYCVEFKNKNFEEGRRFELPTRAEIQDLLISKAQEEHEDVHLYVYALDEKRLKFDVAFDGVPNQTERVKEFASKFVVDLNLNDYEFSSIKEIGIGSFYLDLNLARKSDFIDSEREVKRSLGLPIGDPHFKEKCIRGEEKSKDELLADLEFTGAERCLREEIERIYTPAKANEFGIPCHYIINTSDKEDCDDALEILTQSLASNRRTLRERYTIVDLGRYCFPFDTVNDIVNDVETAYKLNDYGIVVVKVPYDLSESDKYSPEHGLIKQLTMTIDFYSSLTTTILCITSKTNGVERLIRRLLPNLLFVNIAEDSLYGDKARGFLQKLARERKIQLSAAFDDIDLEDHYKPTELRQIFNNWYAKYIKTTLYPQYSEYVEHQNLVEDVESHAFEDLDELIGLKDIKKVVKNYINYAKLQAVCEAQGKQKANCCRHMVFTGNPGTAKTTVARIIAQIMKEKGLLSRGNLVEVGRADLVSQFVGGTAPKVKEAFQNAKGGVLFIDEAYSLCEGREGLYGDEAINTIVQEMENNRGDLVVIFAGYKKEMQAFINRNPGLKSRVAYEIDFPDYSEEELMQIAKFQARQMDVDISDCEETLRKIFAIGKTNPNFGNGRYVRKVLEKARMKQASRIVEQNLLESDQIDKLLPEDFEMPEAVQTRANFGFQM